MVWIHQHQCHGRILRHRVEQQFALYQMRALLAQRASELVVRLKQLPQHIVPIDHHRQTEIPVTIAGYRTVQRTHQPMQWPHCDMRCPRHRQCQH